MQPETIGDDPSEVRFSIKTKETLTTRDPVLIAALRNLRGRWPQSIVFEQLAAELGTTINRASDEVARSLGMSLLRLYLSSRLIELHSTPPAFASAVSDRPVASPLARLQAAETSDVTNLRHEAVRLGDGERVLLRHLDGTRSRSEVVALVNDESVAEGVLEQFAKQALLVT